MWRHVKIRTVLIIEFFILMPFALDVRAGGPLFVSNGRAMVWSANDIPVVYQVDQGRLATLSNYQAMSMVVEAFDKWDAVRIAGLSTLRFVREGGYLPADVTGSNYLSVTNNLPDKINPIIFDDDGSVLNLLFGDGAGEHYLGLTRSYTASGNIVKVEIILNGYFFRQNGYNRGDMLTTVIHEVGHLCGLDHTQFSRHLAGNLVKSDDQYLSMLYPHSGDDDEQRKNLAFDDKIALSNLYPTNAHTNRTGSISGVVKRSDRELPGVNVIVRDVQDPVNNVATTVTGTFEEGRGTYEVAGLPPGEYDVMVEAIDREFTGASSVGRYAESVSDRSFRNRVKPEFYNTGDLDEEARSVSSPVTVRSLRTTTGIDLNVDPANLTDDEENVVLLAINSSTIGSAAAGYYSSPFLLFPSGAEGRIDVVIEFNRSATHLVEYKRELANGQFDEDSIRRSQRTETIVLGEGGDMPLEKTRYFFRVANAPNQSELMFTLSTSAGPTYTPTPTSTPTRTYTPTRTLTPTRTFTSTSTPTSTVTPTPTTTATNSPTATNDPQPTPTFAKTPVIVAGDVNGDGRVDFRDVFSFNEDWGIDAILARFQSDFVNDATGQIDMADLLLFIESYLAVRSIEIEPLR
ncbi:MAG: hypothetical protein C4527_06720 [Candidatus Omnitrophota bacterium]|jgi:hypothetical protein|nr:MAG: hypothetical protein C4527_06720 [Candidatus Omnitrophota bacterium]